MDCNIVMPNIGCVLVLSVNERGDLQLYCGTKIIYNRFVLEELNEVDNCLFLWYRLFSNSYKDSQKSFFQAIVYQIIKFTWWANHMACILMGKWKLVASKGDGCAVCFVAHMILSNVHILRLGNLFCWYKLSKGRLQNSTGGWPPGTTGSGRLPLFRSFQNKSNRPDVLFVPVTI